MRPLPVPVPVPPALPLSLLSAMQHSITITLAPPIPLLHLQRALAPGDLQMNRSDLIAALSGTWGAEPWVACNAS